ncbi:hypothetical protein BYT27DRAFT_7118426 [Phlegmacium glaucopus]|nr:hypothetical protein BYT27DRAFT_7118426 [Phlegmacium glaucopus]
MLPYIFIDIYLLRASESRKPGSLKSAYKWPAAGGARDRDRIQTVTFWARCRFKSPHTDPPITEGRFDSPHTG